MLFITAYFFLAPIFQAQAIEAGDDLKILLEFSPDAIVENEPFTFNILVNHSNPDEIYIEAPDFHDAFRLDRLRVESRLVLNTPREADRWTVYEFLLTAVKSGPQKLEPFQITVFDQTLLTNTFNLQVREEYRDTKAALAWTGQSVRPLRFGDSREAALRITSWEKDKPYPESLPLRIEAPQNAIVEEMPLSKTDRTAGIVLRLMIIPLDEKPVRIDRQIVYYGKTLLEIPPLSISVLPALPPSPVPAAGELERINAGETVFEETSAVTEQKVEPRALDISFSTLMPSKKNIFSLFMTGAEDCVNNAAGLWNRGEYAAALAVLRRGERTLTAGYAVREARVICENTLDLPLCLNEPWLPYRPLFFIFIFFAVFAALFFCLRKIRRISVFFPVMFLAFSLAALLLLFFSYKYEKSRAVLTQCAGRSVPEESVKSYVLFMEGEPVKIRAKSDSWIYAESMIQNSPGKSGWIKTESALMY
ncbi:MAG: BatD family protein [Spirochaetaceae bacterium]|nr:BatD family protein [Spirochaetaceae bacterium]